jgi:hypothetical protein
MKNDIIKIIEEYKHVVENSNISNNMTQGDVSTKYTANSIPKFLPIGQDMDEEELKNLESDRIKQKLQTFFSQLKGYVDSCESKNCNYRIVSHLIELIQNPEVIQDLQSYKQSLQLEDQERGTSVAPSF